MACQNAGTPISTRLFSWHPKTKSFTAEESTLRRGPRTRNGPTGLFQRIYPDAADVGFPMLSADSGKTAWFALDCEDRCNEGEVMGWQFVPTPEAIRENPGLAGVTVLVIND